MKLTPKEQQMLDGHFGPAVQKSMEILTALGAIYGAEDMIPVVSVQVSGVSYANLGEAGLQFLSSMEQGGGRAQVLTTLNPAGMDIENWQKLGIDPEFAKKQGSVLEVFKSMDIITTCSCTPYLFGNTPLFGQHIAWAESSAVCYANSVIGARTNREGGPSALAASITGRTPRYGFHLSENRKPTFLVSVETNLTHTHEFGALGIAISNQFKSVGSKQVPYIQGIPKASVEQLKSLSASIATYCGTALFHIEGLTPEANQYSAPSDEQVVITNNEINTAISTTNDAVSEDIDFVSLGCPHLSLNEIARIAQLLSGKQVKKEFWITTSRPVKQIADRMGFTQIIEASGAIIAADTCCVVAPIRGRFSAIASDSAKACYYGASKNNFKTLLKPFDEVVLEALK
jgi:predicted aconitase